MKRIKKMYISIPDANDKEKEEIKELLEIMLEQVKGQYLVFLTNVNTVEVSSKDVYDKFADWGDLKNRI